MNTIRKLQLLLVLICMLFGIASAGVADSGNLQAEEPSLENGGLAIPTEEEAASDSPQNEQSANIEAVIARFDDDRIAQTHRFLAGGGTISQGDKHSNYRGLQVVLNVFDGALKVDGSIGEKTFEQLRAVQAAYGLPTHDEVVLADFEALLIDACILHDPVLASGALGFEYTRRIDYVLGIQYALRGNNSSAKQQFDKAAGYLDSDVRAAACVQEWPPSGVVVRDGAFNAEECQLTVETHRREGQATYFKIYSGDILVCALFIPGTGSATVILPEGSYTCKAGVGETWYGQREAFGTGDDAIYQRLTFQDGADKATFRAGYKYSLILGGAEQNNVNTRDEDPGTF